MNNKPWKKTLWGKNQNTDPVAENGREIVVVEVKSSLYANDVNLFITHRLSKIRKYFPKYAGRTIYGAVTYLKNKTDQLGRNGADYALKQGLFVISVTGNTARVTNKKPFTPKTF